MLNYLCDLSALQIVLTGRRKFFYLADVESQVGMLAGLLNRPRCVQQGGRLGWNESCPAGRAAWGLGDAVAACTAAVLQRC